VVIPSLIAVAFARQLKLYAYNFVDGFILWSLVCELFYYTLYPLFVLIRQRIGWHVQFCIAMIVSYTLVILLGSDEYGNAHIYGPFLNWLVALPSWLAGCILAETVSNGRFPGQRQSIIAWRLGVALTASCLYWLTLNSSLGYYLTMNAFSILVIFWLGAEISQANRVGSGILERVGKWSFSIYLFHIIAFTLIGKILHVEWTGPKRLLAIPLILLFCYFAYRLIEKPSHRYARYIFKKLGPLSISHLQLNRQSKSENPSIGSL
jgi:peptidoglycan/LPS O-acetylase OafA/YrhL